MNEVKANKVETGINYLFGNKWIARIVIFYFIIVGVGNFFDGINKIESFVSTIYSRMASWNIDNHKLIAKTRGLATNMRTFLGDRLKEYPVNAPGADLVVWQKNSEIRQRYENQTTALFNSKFQADTVRYYLAYKRIGITDSDLDSYTQNNYIFDLNRFPNELDSIATKLELMLSSTTNQSR